MNRKEPENLSDVALEKELLVVWRRMLKNDTLTIDDDFFECGGDSLLATQVMLEIEALTGKLLPPSIVFETGTVRLLVKKIMTADEIKPRVSILTGPANGKIIHFFHGDFEHGGAFIKNFSKMLGTDYLIHSIAPHIPREGMMPNSIEEMAIERLPIIIEKQQDGPYILLGQCNGAFVGFEVARQLVLMGKEVKALVMVDPAIMSIRRSARFIYITTDFFMRLMGVDKSKRHDHLIWIWRKMIGVERLTKDFWRFDIFFFQKTWFQKKALLNDLQNSIGNIHKAKIKSSEREITDNHYFNVLFDYQPVPLDVPVLYIALEYCGRAWRRIARDMIYINIYRGHHTSWKENYSQDLVNKIRGFIKD